MEETYGQHFLYPGTLFADAKPHKVSTVLGSCVAICFWDRALLIGGINHFMLPLWNGEGLATPKYGTIANAKLLERMYAMGSKKHNLVAKVFGGGEIIESTNHQFNIGERNAMNALQFLHDEGITIAGQSLGGKLGRKILYNTQTGEVLHKFIQKTM